MNKNIVMLAKLYDSAANELQNILASERVVFNDPRIVDKVKRLGEIAHTLSLVYQIESMRAKSASKDPATPTSALALPEEKVVVDPALTKAQKQNQVFTPNNTKNDLSGFRSPGGWVP